MTTTTFDFAKALKGDVAQPHGDDVDGKVTRARMDLNYSVVPADPAAAAKLAPRYVNAALGEVTVIKEGAAILFDAGEWKSAVASRKNDDGTISFITIDPTLAGMEFVVADKDGKRRLITRDAQHEYVFEETAKR